MSKYKYYRILRFFRLLSKEAYKEKVAPYLADMDMNCRIIEKSRLFDKKWYLEHNPDVKEDPIKHYLYKGWKEHRECTPYFNGEDYLKMYPDVAEANMNPLLHWELHGKFEGRYAETHPIRGLNFHNIGQKLHAMAVYPITVYEECQRLELEIKNMENMK